MTRAEERKRATELKVLDVRELLKTSFSAVLPQLAAPQLDQLQRVLDVAVINADVQKRYEDLDRLTIKGRNQYNQPVRDPNDPGIARRDQVLKQKVAEKPGENFVPLNFYKLLTPDALKTTSDNPDEASYLHFVADVYEHRGVWLVLDQDSSGAARNAHPDMNDPKRWRVRLLLGYKSGALVEEITSDSGHLTQKALLSVSRLGAGYWEFVHQGPTLTSLRSALDRIQFQISYGRNEHFWWSAHRSEYYVTSRVSDKLGGADWPHESIWDQPHYVQVQARHLINDGKLMQASKYALLAAYQTMWCGNALHEYIEDTTRGATRAAKILEVAAVAGEIAGAILTVIAIGGGLIRLLGRRAATGALEAGATQRQLTGGGQRQLTAGSPKTPTPVSGNSSVASKGGGGSTGGPRTVVTIEPVKAGPVTSGGVNTQMIKAANNLRQKQGLEPLVDMWADKIFVQEVELLAKAQRDFFALIKANPKASMKVQFEAYDRIKARLGVKFILDPTH